METRNNQISTMDEYICGYPENVQRILEQMRQTIREAAPGAVETISYHMPAFKLDGKQLVQFAAWKNHIGVYALPTDAEAFEAEAAPYKGPKGSLRFPINKPIPFDLIARMVSYQLREDAE